jgi:preprotein translocase subunit YajC
LTKANGAEAGKAASGQEAARRNNMSKKIQLGTEVLTATGQRGTLTEYEDGRAVVRLNEMLSFVVDVVAVAPIAEVEIVPVTVKTAGVEIRKFAEATIAWQRARWLVRVGGFSDLRKTRAEALTVAASMVAVARWQGVAQ